MNQLTAYHLILRYPALKTYIIDCFNNGHIDDMLDLLHGLEVDDGTTTTYVI